MRARIVIGANFGDEGKGLITDYLCRTQGADVVVRFNSGAQAGHTVVDNSGRRHVFKHFGSGSFCGVPTFLSKFFICNPVLFFQELDELEGVGLKPSVYAHPECLVTTYADMVINQELETARGEGRHGSCGIGFGETIERANGAPELTITMADLWNNINLESKLSEICDKYATFRTGHPVDIEGGIEHFIKGCEAFAEYVSPLGIGQCKDPIFEGAQGLLLDQDNKENFPHVTRSNTGMKNAKHLCDQAGIGDIDAYYVSRTYLTKHGAGPLPGEDTALDYEDETNLFNESQGRIRFAPLDVASMWNRCAKDAAELGFKKVLTHCDQLAPTSNADLYSYGVDAEAVHEEIHKPLGSINH